MWMLLFLWLQAPGPTTLDYDVFKSKVEPLLLEKRPGHARCYVCHSTGTAFRLQMLSPGAAVWNDEQSQKNFEVAKRFVKPGAPLASRMLTMPLAEDAGGVAFHPGGKHWASQTDPEWQMLADWVNGRK
ncbi:MAG TPA: hypothetical protein VH583_03350 [Vicinamibacterales bacterium]|jgi:hypothetical protein